MKNLFPALALLLAVSLAQAQKRPLEQRVSIEVADSLSLATALEQLSARYSLQFAYDADLLERTYVSQAFQEKPLETVLKAWLYPQKLNFETAETVILIFPDRQAPEPAEEQKPLTKQISGVVRDARSGEQLPYAHVSVQASGYGTVTNQNGRFTLLKVTHDAKAVIVSYIGYRSDTIRLNTAGDDPYVEVGLQPQARTLDEVSVEENAQSLLRTNQHPGVHTVDPFRLETLATTGQGGIMQALKLLPGIGAANEGARGFHVRGGKADQNLVLFDGFTIYHIDHVYGIFDAINADAVKHIRMYKGGFPARYGNRISSVVDITGKDGNRSAFKGLVGADFMSLRARLESPLGRKTSALITGRHSFTQFLHEDLYQEVFNTFFTSGTRNHRISENIAEAVSLQPRVRFYDMNARIVHHTDHAGTLTGSFFTGADDLQIHEENQQGSNRYYLDEHSAWGNTGAALNWYKPWNQRHESNLDVSYSSYKGSSAFDERFVFGQGHNNRRLNLEHSNKLRDLSVRGYHQYHWNTHLLRAGVKAIHYESRFRHLTNAGLAEEINQQSLTLSAFAENAFELTPSMHLNTGIRVLQHNAMSKWFWEPRIALYYETPFNLTLKAAYGRYHQFLSQLQLDRFQSGEPVFWLLADGQLFGEAAASHYIAGLQYRHGPWLLDVEGYYKPTTGITGSQALFNPYVERDSIAQQLQLPTNGTNVARGLDVLLQRTAGAFTGWVSYSLSSSRNRFEALNQGEPFPVDYDRRHEINAVLQFRHNKWTFGTKWIYGSGSPYTKPDPENPTEVLFDTENLNACRLPGYHRLDLSVKRNMKLKGLSGELGLSLINVYNRTNIRSRVYRLVTEGGQNGPSQQGPAETTVQAYDLELMHFMPNVFVRVRF